MTVTKEEVKQLVVQVVGGDNEAFRRLEEVAKPLLLSLSYQFSGYHPRFDPLDFYAISLEALHTACIKFNPRNPSFLHYAKSVITNRLKREMEYWSAKKRNIFIRGDCSIEDLEEGPFALGENTEMEESLFLTEFRERTQAIINECYEKEKADILRTYLFQDKRIVDIAQEKGLKYKKVYSTVTRGLEQIKQEYLQRHDLDDPYNL